MSFVGKGLLRFLCSFFWGGGGGGDVSGWVCFLWWLQCCLGLFGGFRVAGLGIRWGWAGFGVGCAKDFGICVRECLESLIVRPGFMSHGLRLWGL